MVRAPPCVESIGLAATDGLDSSMFVVFKSVGFGARKQRYQFGSVCSLISSFGYLQSLMKIQVKTWLHLYHKSWRPSVIRWNKKSTSNIRWSVSSLQCSARQCCAWSPGNHLIIWRSNSKSSFLQTKNPTKNSWFHCNCCSLSQMRHKTCFLEMQMHCTVSFCKRFTASAQDVPFSHLKGPAQPTSSLQTNIYGSQPLRVRGALRTAPRVTISGDTVMTCHQNTSNISIMEDEMEISHHL